MNDFGFGFNFIGYVISEGIHCFFINESVYGMSVYILMNYDLFVVVFQRPSRQLFTLVGTEPSIPGHYKLLLCGGKHVKGSNLVIHLGASGC